MFVGGAREWYAEMDESAKIDRGACTTSKVLAVKAGEVMPLVGAKPARVRASNK